MNISELICRHVRIPLKRKIKHASFERTSTDTLIVSCRLSDGTIGWGEGLPRDYVTGDTIESSLALFQATDWAHILSGDLHSAFDAVNLVEQIVLPTDDREDRQTLGNPLKCAVELSILDAVSRSLKLPFRHYLEAMSCDDALLQPQERVRYSGIIATSSRKKIKWHGRFFRWSGFRDCKVKVGMRGLDDFKLLKRVRRFVGPNIALRIDANEGWSAESLTERCQALKPFHLVSVEQPVPHSEVMELAELRPKLELPLMLDESLCSFRDAQRAIDFGLCDLFNIRLSKCGGFVNSVKLAQMAQRAGLGFQLGSQVGETGILSAAGRQFATNIRGWMAAEGSFDRYLVKERLTREDLTFHRGGLAPALTAPGLGMSVDPKAVKRVTVSDDSWST